MTTISEIREGHFDGGSNLTRGSRVKSDALLVELLGQTKVDITALETGSSSAIIFVDKNYTGTLELGSLTHPYKTVQMAINNVIQSSTIKVAPGVYEEAIVYNGDIAICLEGESGYLGDKGVRIDSVGLSAPALTVTNATLASLSTYRVSGTYSDLLNKGSSGCRVFVTRNISFSGDTDENCIELLGVKGDVDPNTTAFCVGKGFQTERVDLYAKGATYKGLYAKNTYTVFLREFSSNGITDFSNVAYLYGYMQNQSREIICEYDAASPDGQPQYGYASTMLWHTQCKDLIVNQGITMEFVGSDANDVTVNGSGLFYPICSYVDGNLVLNDTGGIVAKDLTIDGNLDVNGASGNVSALGITISGDLTMTVGKTATLNAPHIAGDVTLDNGAGVVVLNGGEYMGALTDVGGRLTRNVGS